MYHQKRLIRRVNDTLTDDPGSCPRPFWQKYAGLLTLEDMFTTDSVYICSQRCAAGMTDRSDTRRWQENPWLNSYLLAQAILNETFVPKFYQKRQIRERGKARIIEPPVFDCKVVQKVLCDYMLRELLTARMISTSYASLTGRGTDMAYTDVLKGLNEACAIYPEGVAVQTDYHSYFASIDNDLMEADLRKLIADQRVVRLIRSFSPQKYGQSLGSEIAQIPASWYPSPIDHDIKDRYSIHFAYRFMDDGLYILPDATSAGYFIEWFTKRSAEMHLMVNEHKTTITPLGREIRFCKQRYYYNPQYNGYYFVPNPKLMETEIRKLRKMAKEVADGTLRMDEVNAQYKGVFGNIAHMPNSRAFTDKLEAEYKRIFADQIVWVS